MAIEKDTTKDTTSKDTKSYGSGKMDNSSSGAGPSTSSSSLSSHSASGLSASTPSASSTSSRASQSGMNSSSGMGTAAQTQTASTPARRTGSMQQANSEAAPANPADVIQDAVGQIIDSIFRSLQPRVHDAVTQFASRAVGSSDQSARTLVATARRSPWYTAGGIALLVVGFGLVLGLENRSTASSAGDELH